MSPTFNLPTTANKLTKDKWYAWQIVAKDNDNYAGKSETWVFKLIEPKPKILTASKTFIELQNNQEPGGITYINGRLVNIQFHSFEAATKSTVNILDAKGRILQKKQIDIIPGDNFISIDLQQGIKTANVYQISVKIAATKTLAASFILQ